MNQALYLESINIMTKEFLAQKNFDDFIASLQPAFTELLQHNEVEKDTIRKAIMDFMAQRGMKALVLFGVNGITIKCSIINCEKNAYIDFLVRFLDEQHYIERLKSGDNSCLKEIFLSLQDIKPPNDAFTKDIVRGALKKVLGLSDRDGLFFHDLEPLVKSFDFELVQNNAQIREMKKSTHKESLLDEATRLRINQALKDTNMELLYKQITQELIASKLMSMSPMDFLGAFSFLYIQSLAKQLEGIIDTSFSAHILNCYCVESYRDNREHIYEEIAHEVLHCLDSGDTKAREFLGFFDGSKRIFNGRAFYVPVIEDVDSKIWGLNDIEFILHSERDINQAIQKHRQNIANAQKRLIAIEQETRINNEAIQEKQEQIHTLSQEYEEKKLQSQAYEKADIETRNAMTKIINSLLQKKIQTLDTIATLKSKNTTLQEEKYAMHNTQKNSQAEIAIITRENKHSIYRFDNLLRALQSCIQTLVTELDNYA